MGLFKEKPKPVVSELKYPCPAEGCSLVYDDPVTLKRHTDWAHPELEESKGVRKVTDEGKNCPSCGAEGKAYKGEHETVVHNRVVTVVRNRVVNGHTRVVDVGWRCWQCGHEWGFECPPGREEGPDGT